MWRLLSLLIVVTVAGYGLGMILGWYGAPEADGNITIKTIKPERLAERLSTQRRAAPTQSRQQILFGDLHVHTTFSSDAFRMSLPFVQGEGSHPPADACDYARYCSALDFWSINDHAEGLTPDLWAKTKASIRACNAVAGDASNPDMVAFLGWEWTQSSATAQSHYGHKNVLFLDTDEDKVPTRPIASASNKAFTVLPAKFRMLPPLYDLPNRQRYYDYDYSVRQVGRETVCDSAAPGPASPADCKEYAETPTDLFAQLAAWDFPRMVIPHGNAWGIYTPAMSSWDKQLRADMNDPSVQFLLEIFSGHGNAEEYRDWRTVDYAADSSQTCPAPSTSYLPSCWRAGEIIYQRCAQEGEAEAECQQRAGAARELYVSRGLAGWLTVPGATTADWLDAGQCRDCYLPAFNYRPAGSAQYAQAVTNFDEPKNPLRFRFGFIGSSDNHSGRPGTGFKEQPRRNVVDWWGYFDKASQARFGTDTGPPVSKAAPPDMSRVDPFGMLELERQASFFLTGGLVAVHVPSRDRQSIWNSLQRKEVYATSGERILLWFDLLNNDTTSDSSTLPMGSETIMSSLPRFRATAVGAFKQLPGCPQDASAALSEQRLQSLCRGECYNPSDERQRITHIDVVRILPQMQAGEPIAPLITDPWKRFKCEPSAQGCTVEFEDPDFSANARDAVYYVRAVQEPDAMINADNLRCEHDKQGNCVAVNPCYGDYRTADDDNCHTTEESKAWSSPIFIDYRE
ncbi:MAG: DUF3604 domain-containing protein [Pseudomonadales bacterium]